MHHQDFTGDPTGSRKAAFNYRRGSSGVNPGDDSQMQAESSSPGPHQQPQSQPAAAQAKKKSGFQITSVTSAQISGNNSLADDTESYDDMDESHTEELSSDMLDVSASKPTDTGVLERSSSEETLNSLQGVDSPGVVSPNDPLKPHPMINGSVHQHPYPQPQQSHAYHHQSESLGRGELSLQALPVAPLATSSPAMASRTVPVQYHRPDAAKLAPNVGETASDHHTQGSVNTSHVSVAHTTGFDNTNVTGGGSGLAAAAPASQSHHSQTHTSSRFRVVKLDTNSEPFRKGRWTCTEYYEKEVPQPTTSEPPKVSDMAAETETGNSGILAAIPHTLHPYPTPSQDFPSSQSMQSPPQGRTIITPLTYVPPQEVGGGISTQKPVVPVAVQAGVPQVTAQVAEGQQPQMSQQLPYAMDPHHPAPHFHAGSIPRQPDFIQPTAPFQTQVQPPMPQVQMGISMSAPQPISISHQLPHQGHFASSALSTFIAGQSQTQIHPPSTAVSIQGSPYMPLTALQADLQPILTPGAPLARVAGGGTTFKTSHLEDAQKLLLHHQGFLGLPKLGTNTPAGVGSANASGAAGSLAQMGMSAEASALMVAAAAAAAAGLRTQPAEGEEDSSTGASVVAIDNKIEQAMDLVKSHLMYAVREEVEVLKEQINELIERNSQLEQENNLLKNLASPEQMAQFQAQVQTSGSPTGTGQPSVPVGSTQVLSSAQNSGSSA
ncbi:TSC22 domain family protein 1 isoform X1 [Gouania willdenowi]|uniref:TSC22 domain family protein 1 n=1 Tax=Gouania willdenowi TaxID=441366 RepID=A0A8C5EGG1_GOUWI|nr:TSC22 domain family protein 1 isoform X1 [Gouania willdenowi]